MKTKKKTQTMSSKDFNKVKVERSGDEPRWRARKMLRMDAELLRPRGTTFCSPACGHGCTRVEFDCARMDALTMSRNLGDGHGALGEGWKPVVWENLGWHKKVVKGECEIIQNAPDRFWAEITIDGDQFEHHGKTVDAALYGLIGILKEAARDINEAREALEYGP